MKKNIKIKFSLLCTFIFVLTNCGMAYAAPTVTETKDNITVTKTAEWTTVDGKTVDEAGNPYAKVTFKVDTTKAADNITNIVSKGGDADIVIVLDNSGSMGDAFKTAKKVAAEFATKMIDLNTYNVRVGLVTIGSTGVRAVDFTSDKQKISDAITKLEFDPVMWGTNFQEGIYETQNMLASSNAPNKLVVFQSDGVPEQCYKKVNCTNKTGANIATGKDDKECAINQTKIMNRLFPDVKMATIGYKTNTSNEDVLYEMASLDASGKKMFYRTQAQASELVTDLSGAFKQIGETVTNYVYGNSLTDKVPTEYKILQTGIKVNDQTVKSKINNDENVVTFKWDKIEKKVYEMSFIIQLNMDKVPAKYKSSENEVYTNGTTIDTSKDSSGSAIFTYGVSDKIELKSPTLKIENKSLAGQKEGETTKNDVGLDKSPKTSDSSNVLLLISLMGVSLIAMTGVIVYKKKK